GGRVDHDGVACVDLPHASGIVQVVVREDDAHQLRNETVVKATGTVSVRPEGNTNPNLPTGEIEVIDTSVEVLSEASALPFQVSDHTEDSGTVGEETRLRYRYLDLRRSGPAKTMRLRSEVNKAALPFPRPLPFGPDEASASAFGGQQRRTLVPRCPRLPSGRGPDPDEVDARRRPRLPRPGPAQARLLVRPAPVPAAVQTAASGR